MGIRVRNVAQTEKRKGKCEACEKPNRVLARIESGQWLCHTCRKSFGPSKAERAEAKRKARLEPTERQIVFARELGMEPEGLSRRQLSPMITVGLYLRDLRRQGDVALPQMSPGEYTKLLRAIADARHLIERMDALDQERYDRAFDEQERLKTEMGDPYADIDIYSLYPPIPLDATFHAFRDVLVGLGYAQAKQGILSRIFRARR